MRGPFQSVRAWLGGRRHGVGAGDKPPAQAPQPGTLAEYTTTPVVLIPPETPLPASHHRHGTWKRSGLLAGAAALLFGLGTAAGLLISSQGRSGGGGGSGSGGVAGRAADAHSLQAGMPTSFLPGEDLRIAPTARDSTSTDTLTTDVAEPAARLAADPASAAPRPSPSRRPDPGAASTAQPERTPPSSGIPDAAPSGRTPSLTLPGRDAPPVSPPPSSPEAGPAREAALPAEDSLPFDMARTPVLDSVVPLATAAQPETLEVRDAQADRSAIRLELLAGVGRLVGLINSRNEGGNLGSVLLDPKTMADLTTFIKNERPVATLGTVNEVVLDGSIATADVSLVFEWRGSFGVQKKEASRFTAEVRRHDTGWRFAGVRLAGSLP